MGYWAFMCVCVFHSVRYITVFVTFGFGGGVCFCSVFVLWFKITVWSVTLRNMASQFNINSFAGYYL